MDSVNLAAIALLQEQLRDAKAYINTLELEAKRNQDCHDLQQKQWFELTAKANVAEVNLSHAQRDIRYFRAENRALRIQLRAANKGAERNAHKLRQLYEAAKLTTLGYPPMDIVRDRLNDLAKSFDL